MFAARVRYGTECESKFQTQIRPSQELNPGPSHGSGPGSVGNSGLGFSLTEPWCVPHQVCQLSSLRSHTVTWLVQRVTHYFLFQVWWWRGKSCLVKDSSYRDDCYVGRFTISEQCNKTSRIHRSFLCPLRYVYQATPISFPPSDPWVILSSSSDGYEAGWDDGMLHTISHAYRGYKLRPKPFQKSVPSLRIECENHFNR